MLTNVGLRWFYTPVEQPIVTPLSTLFCLGQYSLNERCLNEGLILHSGTSV